MEKDIYSRLEFHGRHLPVILQSEAAECGLASLAMVSAYYGKHVDLPALRVKFAVSLKGSKLSDVVRYAEQLQLTARPLRIELDELRKLRVPCILHWDLNHFVVLKSANKKKICIHDPAYGKRWLTYDEVSRHFTGVALEFSPTTSFTTNSKPQSISIRNLIGRVHGLPRNLTIIFLMAAALEAFALISPMFNQWIVDEALSSGDLELLNVLILGFAILLAVQTSISLARSWTLIIVSTNLNLQWLSNVFAHLLSLPASWFEKRNLGDVISKFSSTNAIQATMTTGFVEGILDGLTAMATLGMMFIYSPLLSCVVLCGVAIYACIRIMSYETFRAANQESIALDAKVQSFFLESIRGVQAVKLFDRVLDRRNRWANLKVDAVNRSIKTQKMSMLFGIGNTALFGVQNLLVFWLAARLILQNSFTIGMLFAFTSYSGQFVGRFGALIDRLVSFRMLSLHGERLADIVLASPEELGNRLNNECGNNCTIELKNVSFRYGDSEPWILRNLSLKIEPGESIAIVGQSGCGKTTLLKILLGLLHPVEGELHINGISIKNFGVANYRRSVGAVMQDDQLFSGSIADNIAFFDPLIEQNTVEKCARLAAIDEDIRSMPMGYHTLTGDMGTTLSGGQKQRVILARALCKKPNVLILDEATSHLDVRRERMVNEALKELGLTIISVAHRAETIAMARRVVTLEGGEIKTDSRSHNEGSARLELV